ncbi:hypothetical protein IW144_000947 [Coemansia sp. RSA 522]|nr:hypothetical protein IW144_000947 [Coemansia sp. RSA 522]KAJ2515956.1 hypothetical protein GGH20_004860 [Coemansia sp. RSA 1937]
MVESWCVDGSDVARPRISSALGPSEGDECMCSSANDERDDEYAGVWHGSLADRSCALIGVSDDERSRYMPCGAHSGELAGDTIVEPNIKYSDDGDDARLARLLSEWRQSSLQYVASSRQSMCVPQTMHQLVSIFDVFYV